MGPGGIRNYITQKESPSFLDTAEKYENFPD